MAARTALPLPHPGWSSLPQPERGVEWASSSSVRRRCHCYWCRRPSYIPADAGGDASKHPETARSSPPEARRRKLHNKSPSVTQRGMIFLIWKIKSKIAFCCCDWQQECRWSDSARTVHICLEGERGGEENLLSCLFSALDKRNKETQKRKLYPGYIQGFFFTNLIKSGE